RLESQRNYIRGLKRKCPSLDGIFFFIDQVIQSTALIAEQHTVYLVIRTVGGTIQVTDQDLLEALCFAFQIEPDSVPFGIIGLEEDRSIGSPHPVLESCVGCRGSDDESLSGRDRPVRGIAFIIFRTAGSRTSHQSIGRIIISRIGAVHYRIRIGPEVKGGNTRIAVQE